MLTGFKHLVRHNIVMKKALIAGGLYALPFVALAQTGSTLVNVTETVSKIINLVVPIVGALLIIYFFLGVAKYVGAGADAEKQAEARNTMIYAVIGMFVAFSIFGLVALLNRTFGLGTPGSQGTLPGIDTLNW